MFAPAPPDRVLIAIRAPAHCPDMPGKPVLLVASWLFASGCGLDTNGLTAFESHGTSDATESSPSEASTTTTDSPPTTSSPTSDTDGEFASSSDPSSTAEHGSDGSASTSGSATNSDTETLGDTATDSGSMICKAPPANEECETCLYDNCKDEYCACTGDAKCQCQLTCLDVVTGGPANALDELLALDLDDLQGGLLDGLLGDLYDDMTVQDFEDLAELLECLSNDPCGVALGLVLEDLLDGTDLGPEDLPNLKDLLELDDLDNLLINLLEVMGNSLAPLLTCSELTNPDGQCGTICPLEESVLDD